MTWGPRALSFAPRLKEGPEGLTDTEARNILGASGCMWTDMFLHKPFLADIPALNERRSERYVEYFSLPRMAALAAVRVQLPSGDSATGARLPAPLSIFVRSSFQYFA